MKRRTINKRDIERAERKYFSFEDQATTVFRKWRHRTPLHITAKHLFNKLLLTVIYRGNH